MTVVYFEYLSLINCPASLWPVAVETHYSSPVDCERVLKLVINMLNMLYYTGVLNCCFCYLLTNEIFNILMEW